MSERERTVAPDGGEPWDEACARCGSESNLVEDPVFDGLYLCGDCLERVEAQNAMIDRGLEDEPEVAS